MNRVSKFLFIGILLTGAANLLSQTTAFTYQGRLDLSGSPANGTFDFEFLLFGSESGGTQIGSTVSRNGVSVANGMFSVSLDFGNQFPGSSRFIEIRVRQVGGGAYTTLSPRHPISSNPYAVRSLTAATAEAVTVGGIPSGSGNYIQNTNTQQPSSNFNISGNGTAGGTLQGNLVNAITEFRLNGYRFLAEPGNLNLSVGRSAGLANSSGELNTYVGYSSGLNNSTGSSNAFSGALAGNNNTSGSFNAFFGRSAGSANTTGGNNTFFGAYAGTSNVSGSRNTLIGFNADVLSPGLINATAIGVDAAVGASNSLVLGRINGVNGASSNTNVGIGTTAPTTRLEVSDNGGSILFGGAGCPSGSVAIGLNGPFSNCTNYTIRGNGVDILLNRPTGGEILVRENNGSTQVRIKSTGILQLNTLGTAGLDALCRNSSNDVAGCSSSIRYKTNVASFTAGTDIIHKLSPVSFEWKEGGSHDIGLIAEEVAAIEPRLITLNDKGEIEGVKYDRMVVVLVNAIKEQQEQMEKQRRQLEIQQQMIVRLSKQICEMEKGLAICKEGN